MLCTCTTIPQQPALLALLRQVARLRQGTSPQIQVVTAIVLDPVGSNGARLARGNMFVASLDPAPLDLSIIRTSTSTSTTASAKSLLIEEARAAQVGLHLFDTPSCTAPDQPHITVLLTQCLPAGRSTRPLTALGPTTGQTSRSPLPLCRQSWRMKMSTSFPKRRS